MRANTRSRPRQRDAERRRQRPGRTLLVLFFATGIAGLGLLSGGEQREADAVRQRDPMAGYFDGAMPRYPDVKEAPAGPDTRIGGASTRMSHFVTGDDPAKIRDAIENTREFVGLSGIYNMSPDDHNGLNIKDVVLVKVQGGKFRLVK